MHIYKRTEPQLWTVGYYENDRFEPLSDHFSAEEARNEVILLNGGSLPEQEAPPLTVPDTNKLDMVYRVIWTTPNRCNTDKFTWESYERAQDRMEVMRKIYAAPQWEWRIVAEPVLPPPFPTEISNEEYKEGLLAIKKKAQHAERAFASHYARVNNPVSIGDVITDHYQTIIVETMKPHSSIIGKPMMVYLGPLLKKDGSPYKNGKTGNVYQLNIVSHTPKSDLPKKG